MTQAHSNSILEKLFSNDFFSNVDTASLVKQYDISAGLRSANGLATLVVLPTVQTSFDISSIPPEGIVINTPGQYQFANDITWAPLTAGAAISIQADNVVLDLMGYTLQANLPDITQNYIGISVSKSNTVSVKNGVIQGMSYYGLSSNTVAGLQLNSLVVNGLAYMNTSTKNATPCGFFIDTTNGFNIQNCGVKNVAVTSASCAGIQALGSQNGTIAGCSLSGFVNNDGAVQGFSYLLSWGIDTNDCDCTDFQSHYLGETDTTGHTVLGYIPIFCVDLTFENCTSTGMTGCCDDCHGMSIFLDAFIEVNNFTAKNVTDGVAATNTGAKATGLEVYGIGIILNNCSVENIMAIVPQDLQSAGFSACGSSIAFYNCTAKNVVVTDANRQPNTAFGYGTGFGWAPDPRTPFKGWAADQVTYNNCTSADCQLGFDTWFHTNSVWERISAPGCADYLLVQPDGTPRTLSIDKCSESPSGKHETVTITNIAENNTYPEFIIKGD